MKIVAVCLIAAGLAALPAFGQTATNPVDPNTFQSEFQIVSAKVEPTKINMNHSAIITVRVVQQSQSGQPPKITIPTPKVDGLAIRPDATNWYKGSTDGVYKTTTQQTFTVRPLAPGDYTIPAFDINSGGKTYHVASLTFKVTP